MSRGRLRVLLPVLAVALFAACGDPPKEGVSTSTIETTIVAETSSTTEGTLPPDPGPPLTLEVFYLPGSPQDVFRVIVHNSDPQSVDVTGWTLHTRGLPGVVFEWGTIVPGNGSLDVLQVVAIPPRCPSSHATLVVYCYHRDRGIEPVLLAGILVLEDAAGTVMAESEPPPGV